MRRSKIGSSPLTSFGCGAIPSSSIGTKGQTVDKRGA
jgi:hypothetical protein